MKISVILPIYNEEGCIENVVAELCGALKESDSEVILVDDGSDDHTPAILSDLAHRHDIIRVLTLKQNSGQSAAFWCGFKEAAGELIALMDADGQNVPSDIHRCVSEIVDNGADICCGYRATRNDTWSKRIGSKMANAVRRKILKDNIIDTGCSMKVFRSSLLKNLEYWDGMHRFLPILASRCNTVKIFQIPVAHRKRSAGRSKYTNLRRLKRSIRDLFGVVWLKNRSKQFTYTKSDVLPSSTQDNQK